MSVRASSAERIGELQLVNIEDTCMSQGKCLIFDFFAYSIEIFGKTSNAFKADKYVDEYLPASGALTVFSWMRIPNVSETHVDDLITSNEKNVKMAVRIRYT